jgi:hypothetical protein
MAMLLPNPVMSPPLFNNVAIPGVCRLVVMMFSSNQFSLDHLILRQDYNFAQYLEGDTPRMNQTRFRLAILFMIIPSTKELR